MAAFAKIVSSADELSDPLFRRIITNVIQDIPAILTDMATSKRDFLAELADIKSTLDKNFTPEDARAFKMTLLSLGKNIAKSSGGLFSRISKGERKTLAVIAASLGVADK